MIIIKLIGGLGNQMFQYALGRNLARINQVELKLDITGFKTYKLHAYGLEHFNITKNYATAKEVLKFQKYQKKRGRRWFLYNKFVADEQKYVQEKFPHFDPSILKTRDGAYIDGYWQSEKYFLPIAKEIREAFTPSKPLSAEGMAMAKNIGDESISLHIRRGDYVTNKKAADALGICNPIYYEHALAQAISGLKNPHVFVFSDDIAWVKENLSIPCPATYVSGQNLQNWEELLLMSYCTRHILSNSSFSWWGAWLDTKNDTMTIAPARWFKDPALENKDIAPPSWIRI